MSSASDPNVTISFTGEASSAVRTTDALTSALSRLVDAGHRATNGISGLNSSLGRTAHQTRIVGNLGAEYAKVGTALQNVSKSTAQSVAGFNALATAAQRAGAGMGAGAAGGQRGAASAAEKSGGGGLTALLGGAGGMKGMLASTAAFTGVSVGMAMAGNEASKLVTENLNLDKAMSAVAAVGGLDKQGAEYQKLTAMVREYGKSTQYSAVHAATGLRELVAAGYDAADATKLLGDTLDLAASDNLEMGRASEILVSILQSMHLGVNQSTRVVDVMARAANASTASIDDLGESMKYAAPLANTMGITLETTAASIALLANSGVRGGLAGRGFGAMLSRMIAPAEDAANMLAKVGISLSEINPEVVGVAAAFKRLEGVDTGILVKLFGSENLDVASVMINNAKGLDAMTAKMHETDNTAKKMATTMASHLGSGFKRVQGAITELYMSIGKEPYEALVKGTIDLAATLNSHAGEIITFGTHIVNLTKNLFDFSQQLSETIGLRGGKGIASAIGVGVAVLDAIVAGVTGNLEQPPAPGRAGVNAGKVGGASATAMDKANAASASAAARNAEVKTAAAERQEKAEEEYMKAFKRRTDAEAAADVERTRGLSTRQQLLALSEREAKAQRTIADASRYIHGGNATEQNAAAMNAQADLIAIGEERKKLMDETLETQRESAVALRAIEADEARAAGNTTKADALEEQNRLLELQIGYMKQLHVDEKTAEEMAARKMAAEKKLKGMGKEWLVIADSLQSVGGGGRAYTGGNVADMQLRAQQDIAKNTERTANALSGGGLAAGGANGAGSATQAQILTVVASALTELRKITTNTGKPAGQITVRSY